jgi:hypothetical protein
MIRPIGGLCFRPFLLGWLAIFFILDCGLLGATKNPGTPARTHGFSLSVTINNGLLSCAAVEAPFRSVLEALSAQTGTAFIIHSASFSSDTLSVSFSDLTVPEALERVLNGHSYVMEGGDEGAAARVYLLTPQDSDLFSEAAGKETILIGPEAAPPAPSLASAVSPPAPDECSKLLLPARDSSSAAQESLAQDPLSYRHAGQVLEADRLARDQERIRRAVQLLGMGHCSHLGEKALDGLKTIQDPQVTALLAELSMNGETESLKTKAAEALWRNAAGSGFKNTQALQLLQGLSASSHEGVRWYAREALRGYEQYKDRINNSSKETASERKPPSFYQTYPR